MHLAQIVFDIVTRQENVHPDVEHIVPDRDHLSYWKSVLSLAALAHDIGHIPFSHAAEKRILPPQTDHEDITIELIKSDYFSTIWNYGHHVNLNDVIKLAVGKKKLKEVYFTTWESILSEIITGDSFGVDRIDYLLRDSYHTGVTYGQFDHSKLITSLRILPKGTKEEESNEPTLGIEISGLHSAEAMLLARYFMYEQIYFHPVRRIYDQHLIEFMIAHYGANGYKKDIEFHLSQTDNEATVAIRAAFMDRTALGHAPAKAIFGRQHFRLIYSYSPTDRQILQSAIESGKVPIKEDQPLVSPARRLLEGLKSELGPENFKEDLYIQGATYSIFPVLMGDNRIESSTSLSSILDNFPRMTVDSLYAEPNIATRARKWIEDHRDLILTGEK